MLIAFLTVGERNLDPRRIIAMTAMGPGDHAALLLPVL